MRGRVLKRAEDSTDSIVHSASDRKDIELNPGFPVRNILYGILRDDSGPATFLVPVIHVEGVTRSARAGAARGINERVLVNLPLTLADDTGFLPMAPDSGIAHRVVPPNYA
jgi:hypothetical protein